MSHECRFCKAWIRWVKVDGRWKPYDTESNVHNCAARWRAKREAQERSDSKKAAANDVPEKEAA